MRILKISLGLFLVLGVSVIEADAQAKVTVRFKTGTNSGAYNGSVGGSNYTDYILKASEGQTLSVTLTKRSGEPPYFNVLHAGSEVAIADDAREANSWTGRLPKSGTYAVRVYIAKAGRLANRTANYRITFKIN